MEDSLIAKSDKYIREQSRAFAPFSVLLAAPHSRYADSARLARDKSRLQTLGATGQLAARAVKVAHDYNEKYCTDILENSRRKGIVGVLKNEIDPRRFDSVTFYDINTTIKAMDLFVCDQAYTYNMPSRRLAVFTLLKASEITPEDLSQIQSNINNWGLESSTSQQQTVSA